jgi:glycosyltransferase involved in cell wall biosynthesis
VKPLTLGIDATAWQNNRGYGRHARALLSALVRLYPEHRYRFFLDSDDMRETLPAGVEVRRLPARSPTAVAAAANGRRSLADMFRMGRAISSEELDLVLFPTIYSYVPVFTKAKKLVIIHDVIAEKFPELTLPNRVSRLFWNLKVALGRWQADGILTVSEYSRRCLVEHFGLDPGSVFVAGEASDPVFRRIESPQLPKQFTELGLRDGQQYVVYVGGFSPHKNLFELTDAFAALKEEFPEARLVMVGEFRKEVFHSYFGEVRARVESLGIASRVIFPGYVADADLAPLLNLSSVLVLPSLMEGFGLPAVEAAACGCPVIATKESPLPELLGEGGLYIDPAKGQLEGMLRLVLASESRREKMRKAAVQAAGRLSWDAAAHQLMDAIRKVGESCPAR